MMRPPRRRRGESRPRSSRRSCHGTSRPPGTPRASRRNCPAGAAIRTSPCHAPGRRPVPPCGNHRLRAAGVQIPEQPVRAGRPVADEGPEREAARKPRNTLQAVRPGGKDPEAHEVPEHVLGGHGPARQAAPGTSGSLIPDSPFAPAAFWRTLPMLHNL